MRCRAVLVGGVLAVTPFSALAQPSGVVRSTCAALDDDAERLAAFEARALAEIALRNPSVRRIIVRCDATRADVQIVPEVGAPRTRTLIITEDRQQLVDDLLAAVWDLAPEPPQPSPSPPIARQPTPPPARPAPGDANRWFALGRLSSEIWSGSVRGFWGPDAGGGWQRGPWSASLSLGLRKPLQSVQALSLLELGAGAAAYAALLRPLEAGAFAQVWRLSADADLGATPSQRVAWTATAGLTLRLSLEAGPFTLALGPQLLLRLPRVAVAIDEREVAELPWLAGGAALELRFHP